MPQPFWNVHTIEDVLPYFGRNVEHDPRSLRFPVSDDVLPKTLVSTSHRRRIPVLDQGDLGACVGFASHGVAATNPFYEGIVAVRPDTIPSTDADASTEQAISIYSMATELDQFKGTYPPTDTGSSGLAGAKAVQSLGWISGYQHAFSLDAALKTLMASPLSVGTYWTEDMMYPDEEGMVRPTGRVLGGHQYIADELDAENRRVGFTNSWSSRWGLSGRFYMSFDDFGELLDQQGDVTMFVPAETSAPEPVEPEQPEEVTPEEVDRAFARFARLWLQHKGL